MNALTVVGGGLGGLVAAITAAELGAEVRLYEAHSQLGGRWRVSDPPFVLHDGPHVLYRNGPLYPWLRRRGLLGTTRPVPVPALRHFGFRLDDRLRHRPPLDLLRVLLARRAPVDVSFTTWATERFGGRAAGPPTQAHQLLEELTAHVGQPGTGLWLPELEIALRAWSFTDGEVQQTQSRIDRQRLAGLEAIWQRLEPDHHQARIKALLPFLVAVGASMSSIVVSREELQRVYELLLPLVPN